MTKLNLHWGGLSKEIMYSDSLTADELVHCMIFLKEVGSGDGEFIGRLNLCISGEIK